VVVVGEAVTTAPEPVTPVLQAYVVPPLAVSVAVAPLHIEPSLLPVPEVSVTAIDAVGIGFTVMVVEEVAVQPSAFVTVTV